MATLIYATNASLDGYIEDETGSFDWTMPGEDLHAYYNDLVRGVGTFLYGRRLYETMAVWETDESLAAESDLLADFARSWQDADKIVYSTTLESVPTARTRIERVFDPAAVARLKESATRDLAIGGAALGAQALRAGLVDECLLVVLPILVGGGKRAWPDGVRIDLELLDERRFANGTVLLRYRSRG
jgi:dihydrofolate reductase